MKVYIFFFPSLKIRKALALGKTIQVKDNSKYKDIDLVLKLSNGCPRVIIDIWIYGLENWLNNIITRLKIILEKIRQKLKTSVSQILKEIEKLIANVDTFDVEPEIRNELIKENVLILLIHEQAHLSKIEKNPLVGDLWAWQIPAYYYVFKTFYEKDLNISATDVIKIL